MLRMSVRTWLGMLSRMIALASRMPPICTRHCTSVSKPDGFWSPTLAELGRRMLPRSMELRDVRRAGGARTRAPSCVMSLDSRRVAMPHFPVCSSPEMMLPWRCSGRPPPGRPRDTSISDRKASRSAVCLRPARRPPPSDLRPAGREPCRCGGRPAGRALPPPVRPMLAIRSEALMRRLSIWDKGSASSSAAASSSSSSSRAFGASV
mmetsp:Transcript_12072/g.30489  ORF Transcript_12072/g.30489 Transcript_12072/m.30489 type:complete len:207 (+) Transcript_12072:1542-2162(+)